MPERLGLRRRLLKSALSVFCLSESELDTVHAEFQGFSIVIPSPKKAAGTLESSCDSGESSEGKRVPPLPLKRKLNVNSQLPQRSFSLSPCEACKYQQVEETKESLEMLREEIFLSVSIYVLKPKSPRFNKCYLHNCGVYSLCRNWLSGTAATSQGFW